MKKLILSILLLCVSVVVLASCGNKRLFDFENDTYNYIHCIADGKCYKLKSWKNNDVGIKVVTENYGAMFFSEGTYILIENHCPICKH